MLQIGYVIICDDTTHDSNGTLIKRPLPVLTPIGLPSNYSFKVAFSLHDVHYDDFNEANKLRITFRDINDKVIADTEELTIHDENPESFKELKFVEAEIVFNNINLHHEGVHTLTLEVNEHSKEIKIPVKRKQITGDADE